MYQPHKINGKQVPKACSKCDYFGDNFGLRKEKGFSYYRSSCRSCINKERLARKKRIREEDPEKWYRIRRHDQLKKCYGISLAEYEALLEKQGGKCAICGGGDGSRAMPLDHDHTTNKNRAILCHWCNKGLGQFFDSPERLRKAADYLEEHSG